MKKILLAALAAFFICVPVASNAGGHWLVGTLGAQHYVDKEAYTHQWDYGGGYEYQQDALTLSTGGYLNSFGKASYYGTAGYRIINEGAFHISPAVGVVTGYKAWQAPVYGGVTPMVGIVASVEGERVGANVLFTPFFVALQVKVKLFGDDE